MSLSLILATACDFGSSRGELVADGTAQTAETDVPAAVADTTPADSAPEVAAVPDVPTPPRFDDQLGADTSTVLPDVQTEDVSDINEDVGSDGSLTPELDLTPGEEPQLLAAEGEDVEVQTVLHLAAVPPAGYDNVKYNWSVVQPEGARFLFEPSDTVPNPTFAANIVGTYIFSVQMQTISGSPIPPPPPLEVDVGTSKTLHIELLWHTPGDADESDKGPDMGSDLDLHFTHEWANQPDTDQDGLPDPWFDNLFDCFWFNTNPNWGFFESDVDDDPSLDLDDTDGAGPENVNLNLPEDRFYRVGVHYWNDHGYGPSEATVRIYVEGELAVEFGPLEMVDRDLWDVCAIDGGDFSITPTLGSDGSPKVTPSYANPYFYQ